MVNLELLQQVRRGAPWKKLEHNPRYQDEKGLARLRILIAWLYPEILPHRWNIIGSWLLLTTLSAVSVAPILLARKIVQNFEGSSEGLYLHLILLAVVVIAMSLLSFIGTMTLSDVHFRVRHALEEKYARRLLSTPLSYYESNTSGSISLAAFNQIPLLTNLINIVLKNFLQSGTTAIAIIIALFYSDISVGAFSVLLLPFFFLGVKYFGSSMERSVQRTYSRISDLHSYFLENLISVKTIRTLGVSEKRIKEVGRIAGETILGEKRTLVFAGINQFTVEAIFAFGAVVILLILHSRFVSGKTSLSLCVAALAGFGLLVKQIRSMTNGITEVRKIVGASSHIINFLAQPEDATLRGIYQCPDNVLNISVEGVAFSYDNATMVLRDSNMTFYKGKVSGIVGISGAGKSTLVDLILRLRLPTSGQILVNGVNITEFSEEWIRKAFAFVDQEPFLFNTTIRENLLIAQPTLQDQDIAAALEAASAMDFVSALPNGFDSRVGEGGCLLSVGQKQRIALARALVSRPSVLLLDEITSAIDTENEEIIINALCELAPNMLIILISHKDKVLACCDRIYRLEHGISRLVKE